VSQQISGVVGNVIYCFVENLTLSSSQKFLKIGEDLTKLLSFSSPSFSSPANSSHSFRHCFTASNSGLFRHWYFLESTTVTRRSLDCLPLPSHYSRGCWTRLPATLPICVHATMWNQSSVLCTGCRSISVYNTNCVFLCMVLLTSMH